MAQTGFSTSTGIGGGEGDYNPTSTDYDHQPAGESGNIGGGIGDRTQGAGKFGGENVEDLSTGDQYGSSGGYIPPEGQGPPQGAAQDGQGNGPRRGLGERESV